MLHEIDDTPAVEGREGGVGWQCILDLHNCETPHIDDVHWVRRIMLEAAARAGATVVSEEFHRFLPHGISGIIVIAESHLAIHIWPERRFAAADFFTCNSRLKLRAAVAWLTESFAARQPRVLCYGRGNAAVPASERSVPRRNFNPLGAPGFGGPCDDLYIDDDDESGGHWFVRDRTVASRQTLYQKAEILDFAHFGRALVLDGKLQSAERDEYIYHESLVQPALCLHRQPRRVLIVGGGEGATAREVLKHDAVEDVVMVDIDREMVALASEHLKAWHRDSFLDRRLHLEIGDGYEFMARSRSRFDVILMDIVDSFENGPAESLYTAEFYRLVKSRLADGGVLAVQAMQCDPGEWRDHARILDSLSGTFVHARSYLSYVPSFRCTWGFVLASDEIDALTVPAERIDHVIACRALADRLRFYDGITHSRLFTIPKDIRRELGEH